MELKTYFSLARPEREKISLKYRRKGVGWALILRALGH